MRRARGEESHSQGPRIHAAVGRSCQLYDREVRTPSHELSTDRGSAVILSVAISAACWIAFVALAIVVSASDTLSLDQSMLTWVGEHRGSALTSAMRTVTWLGSAAVLYPATLVLALYWWRRDRDWRAGAMLAASLAGSTALYNLFKRIIERPRPPAADAVGSYSHWSFPSGHATQCMAFFAMLVVLATSPVGLGCGCGRSSPLRWCSVWAPRGSTWAHTGSPTCWAATPWAVHGSRCSPPSA